MGGAKRMMEENEARRDIALQIVLEAGVLEQCEFHDDCIYLGGEEIESAFKLANHKASDGKLEGVFENRRQMTDIIKDVVEDHAAEECYACAKNRDE